MDASYKIQRGIHVHLIQFFMCPEFWVHITPASFRSDQILMSSYARVPMPIFSACSRQTAQSVSGWAAWK